MITPREAAEIVKRTQKYEFVIAVKDYDRKHFVVEAIPNEDKLPGAGIQTTFGVDKETGEVTAFYLIPGETLEKYLFSRVCKL